MIFRATKQYAGAGGAQTMDVSVTDKLTKNGKLKPSRWFVHVSEPSAGTVTVEYKPPGGNDAAWPDIWMPIENGQIDLSANAGIEFSVVCDSLRFTPSGVSGNYTVSVTGVE